MPYAGGFRVNFVAYPGEEKKNTLFLLLYPSGFFTYVTLNYIESFKWFISSRALRV
jgi:hypothetical protein